jgi:hypothetical protein
MAAVVTDIQDVLLDDRLEQAVVTVLQRSLPAASPSSSRMCRTTRRC